MGWIVRARPKPSDSVRCARTMQPAVEPFRAVGGVWEQIPADEDAGTPGYPAGRILYVADEDAIVLATREDAVRFAAVLWAAHCLPDMYGNRSDMDWGEFTHGDGAPEFEYLKV